ncbi:MAG: hypothetical protein B6D77_18575 [gamma proteobacterium symbiont of Ctena orbiculata]|nr:MAG: hypothetical protein B6D77_18575 [gamma proteobacterium symbiont of Ctena orbiculata]PVV22804.1 MAG: hypothetical protein B6D78_04395 [gamma proteobacterium symbiont of Ctena orbiculata]
MKQLLWIGTSYKVVGNWPKAVKQAAGYQLHLLQQGFEPDDWKPMKIIGSGVREVRLHTEGEYRVLYIAKFEEGVYVLHAFEKKTQKTSNADIQMAKDRFRELMRARKS